jgi:hypothetical protein
MNVFEYELGVLPARPSGSASRTTRSRSACSAAPFHAIAKAMAECKDSGVIDAVVEEGPWAEFRHFLNSAYVDGAAVV